jgi:Domain of unknown function (DUF1905)
MDDDSIDLSFTGDVFQWRGPSPFYFVAVPDELSETIKALSSMVTYGWGVIPVRVRIGDSDFRTSLFPRDRRYLVPLKDAIRRAEGIADGDEVSIRLSIRA